MSDVIIRELDRNIIDVCCAALEEKGGIDTVILSPGSASGAADHYVISGAASEPQLRAMASAVERRIREELKQRVVSEPGDSSSGWVLLDYGNVLIHLMTLEKRAHYDLEGLWGDKPASPELLEKLKNLHREK